MRTADPITRRFALRILNAAALAGATLSAGAVADSANKIAQKTAGYQDKPQNGQTCGTCAHFKTPSDCEIVAGPISPDAWCRLYRKKEG